MAARRVVIQAAGRTDAGVHALGQVVSFDLSREWDPFRIREALNFHTKPHPVAIVDCAARARRFRGALFGRRRGTTNIASSTAAAGRRSTIIASGTARWRSTPRPCMRRRS